MGESLYDKWIEEEVEDLVKALLLYGVVGLLNEYENWLRRKGYIKE